MNKNFGAISVTIAMFLYGFVPVAIAQEIYQKQNSTYDVNTNVLTFPLTSVSGFGLVQDLVVILNPDLGSETVGSFTLTQGEPVMLLDSFYTLRTATEPQKCLEGNFTGNNASLNAPCAFTGQNWKIVEVDNDFSNEDEYYWLQNQHTTGDNVCLTDEVVDNNRRVAMQACSESNTQQLWKLTPAVDGFYYIENKSTVGFRECLHGTGSDVGQVGLTACSNATDQIWSVNKLGAEVNFSGHWTTTFGGMFLSQKGLSVSGTFGGPTAGGNPAASISGTISSTDDNRSTGAWTQIGTGTFTFILSDDGTFFQGTAGGSSEWCGWREGISVPNPCFAN